MAARGAERDAIAARRSGAPRRVGCAHRGSSESAARRGCCRLERCGDTPGGTPGAPAFCADRDPAREPGSHGARVDGGRIRSRKLEATHRGTCGASGVGARRPARVCGGAHGDGDLGLVRVVATSRIAVRPRRRRAVGGAVSRGTTCAVRIRRSPARSVACADGVRGAPLGGRDAVRGLGARHRRPACVARARCRGGDADTCGGPVLDRRCGARCDAAVAGAVRYPGGDGDGDRTRTRRRWARGRDRDDGRARARGSSGGWWRAAAAGCRRDRSAHRPGVRTARGGRRLDRHAQRRHEPLRVAARVRARRSSGGLGASRRSRGLLGARIRGHEPGVGGAALRRITYARQPSRRPTARTTRGRATSCSGDNPASRAATRSRQAACAAGAKLAARRAGIPQPVCICSSAATVQR